MATNGAVRNFILQHTGVIDPLGIASFEFGGGIDLWYSWDFEHWGDYVELSLTPTGLAVDGAQVQPLVKTVRVGHDERAGGIPVAPYRVSATLITETGARVPLLVALEYEGQQARLIPSLL